jgi:alpha-tubulin suppressor-like RCC1 family protein
LGSASLNGCAIESSIGTPFCWGYDADNEVGDGSYHDQNSPVQVANLTNIVALSTGGEKNVCALRGDGTVWCWGDNSHGQLGDGTFNAHNVPVQVTGLTNIIALTDGCALRADGALWCWGRNEDGQVGDNTYVDRPSPVQIGLSNVVAIGGDEYARCAVLADGTAQCWGDNSFGEVGNNTWGVTNPVPTPVSGLTGAVAINCGGGSTCALINDGTARCWGANVRGEIGDGTTTMRLTPVPVSNLSDAVAIVTSDSLVTCALRVSGGVLCWGDNSSGGVGDGTYNDRYVPTPVSGLTNIVNIAISGSSSYALRADGTLWAWGGNAHGQLGIGSFSPSNTTTPMQVQLQP